MKVCPTCEQRFSGNDWCCPACGSVPQLNEGVYYFAPELAATDDHFVPANYGEIARREAGHFWFRARRALILWALDRYFPNMTSFLEAGCGTGMVLEGIHAARTTVKLAACDLYPAGLVYARERVPSAEFYQLDARRIPFDREFDVVGMFDALEHIEEDGTVLRQLHQTVRPGGGIVLTAPQHPALWSAVDEYSHHRRRYTRLDLTQKVRDAGFEVVRTTSMTALLLPVLLAARLRQPKHADEVQPFAEYALPGILNRMFSLIMRFELLFIRAGIDSPWGGTLLLVAKRRD